MSSNYIPTTEEVIRYIQYTHKKHMQAAQKDYEKWLKENPPQVKKKKKYVPKSKPIKKEVGEVEVNFDD